MVPPRGPSSRILPQSSCFPQNLSLETCSFPSLQPNPSGSTSGLSETVWLPLETSFLASRVLSDPIRNHSGGTR